jgi:serine/threonine protein kinase
MNLGAYTIVRELARGKTFLAHDVSGRPVVLKILPPDCLLEGQLNPNIAQRLRRVREIAMTDVANLRGVERAGEQVFVVWDYAEGVSFETYAKDLQPEKAADLVNELNRVVEHFHATGLVHGALHSGNVLVDPSGRIKLIDVSPLLFLDPTRDEQAVLQLCGNLGSGSDSSLIPRQKSGPRVRTRRRTVVAALFLMLLGAGAGIVISRVVHRAQPPLLTPPRLAK